MKDYKPVAVAVAVAVAVTVAYKWFTKGIIEGYTSGQPRLTHYEKLNKNLQKEIKRHQRINSCTPLIRKCVIKNVLKETYKNTKNEYCNKLATEVCTDLGSHLYTNTETVKSYPPITCTGSLPYGTDLKCWSDVYNCCKGSQEYSQ
jgi:predicted site-specific integrase-resolvase